ncbi:PREDICTED: uncharacterized protein LOC109463584 [Branchiostoma belcheri]|uniref:Uncharacterized protein LOC109463584 n=1 Tax=Branchiostoma belcheri TaxID=7741 RepID=A0A6P4XV72_BRABE|nr:PREDICTED: uncharacterized protein LOC109463584 [Branchiostoma belcheri]
MMSKSVYGLSPAQLAVAAAILVGLSSLLTRRTEIEFTEEIFIEVGEEHVYDFLSDVRLLDLVHPFRVGAFNLTPSTGADGYEEVKYTNIEKVDYFGLYEDALVFPVHTRFMKPLGEIRSSYDVLDGTLLAQQCFSLRAAERNGANGTLVTDTSRIWLPWMYAHFTMWKGGEAHHRILGVVYGISCVICSGNFDESQACADNTTVQECPSEKTVCYSTKWTIPTINNGKGEMTGFTRGCAKVGIEPGCYKNADKIIVCTSYCLTDGCNTDDPGIMTGTLGLECLQCFATSLPSSSEAVDRCRNLTNPAEAEPCTDGNARYCFVQEKIVADRTTQFNRGCSRTQVGAGCREMPEPIVEGTDCIVYCNDFPGCNNATSRAVALHVRSVGDVNLLTAASLIVFIVQFFFYPSLLKTFD